MDAEALLNLLALGRKNFDAANAARYDAQVAAESDPSLLPEFEQSRATQEAAAVALGEVQDALDADIRARVAQL
jgi:hypothetical protein